MRAAGAEIVKVAVMAHSLSDNIHLLQLERAAEHGVDRHGACRGADARAGRTFPLALVLCRRGLRPRADVGCAHARGVQVPRDHRPDRDLWRRRIAADAFSVAGDAQRRVSRGRRRCGLRADGRVRVPRISRSSQPRSPCRESASPFLTRSTLFERADHADDLSRKVGAVNTYRRDALRWEARNTDVSGFLAPLKGTPRSARRARGDSWRWRVGACGRRGARVCRQLR